jgi:Fe-S-cluster containining protein
MTIADVKKKADLALKRDKLGEVIDPVRLEKNSTFSFRCHPGVSCFTRCCRNMNIILTPYDIIRIKNRLGLTADMFLHLYAQPEMLVETGVPVARLKMMEDQGGRCPFVTPQGCQVYSDRPVCCRYYPIGIASLLQREKRAGEEEEFFFLVKEKHCRGFEEPTEWTVDSWRADQEADLYDSMNRGWLNLLLRKRSFGEHTEIPEKARRLFYLVSTNAERFRTFVFESRFLDTYTIDKKTVREIREDDTALMQFGSEYLKHAIFGAESDAVKLRGDILDRQVKKILKGRKGKKQRARRSKGLRKS